MGNEAHAMREDAMPTLSLLLSLKHLEQAHSVEEGLNERLQRIEERLSQSGGLADEGLARSAILAYMSAVESSTVQLQYVSHLRPSTLLLRWPSPLQGAALF